MSPPAHAVGTFARRVDVLTNARWARRCDTCGAQVFVDARERGAVWVSCPACVAAPPDTPIGQIQLRLISDKGS